LLIYSLLNTSSKIDSIYFSKNFESKNPSLILRQFSMKDAHQAENKVTNLKPKIKMESLEKLEKMLAPKCYAKVEENLNHLREEFEEEVGQAVVKTLTTGEYQTFKDSRVMQGVYERTLEIIKAESLC